MSTSLYIATCRMPPTPMLWRQPRGPDQVPRTSPHHRCPTPPRKTPAAKSSPPTRAVLHSVVQRPISLSVTPARASDVRVWTQPRNRRHGVPVRTTGLSCQHPVPRRRGPVRSALKSVPARRLPRWPSGALLARFRGVRGRCPPRPRRIHSSMAGGVDMIAASAGPLAVRPSGTVRSDMGVL